MCVCVCRGVVCVRVQGGSVCVCVCIGGSVYVGGSVCVCGGG